MCNYSCQNQIANGFNRVLQRSKTDKYSRQTSFPFSSPGLGCCTTRGGTIRPEFCWGRAGGPSSFRIRREGFPARRVLPSAGPEAGVGGEVLPRCRHVARCAACLQRIFAAQIVCAAGNCLSFFLMLLSITPLLEKEGN